MWQQIAGLCEEDGEGLEFETERVLEEVMGSSTAGIKKRQPALKEKGRAIGAGAGRRNQKSGDDSGHGGVRTTSGRISCASKYF